MMHNDQRRSKTVSNIFTLSIEPTEGETFQYGFHLGTVESTARSCAADIFKNYTKGGKIRIRTVALKRDGKIFDVYDGEWTSDMWEKLYAEG
jgi:hypothetical protein